MIICSIGPTSGPSCLQAKWFWQPEGNPPTKIQDSVCGSQTDMHCNRKGIRGDRGGGPMLRLLLLSRFSHVRLCGTPQMVAHQAPPSLGFSRQEHWSGLPFPSPMHESEKWEWSCSVVSDPQRPHGLQPSRLLHPWDFPGKSTGVGCHCLLHQEATAAAAAKSLQSCPTLCDPIDGSPPGSPVPGILQTRTLEWVAISFSMRGHRFCQNQERGVRHKSQIFNPNTANSHHNTWYKLII